MAPLQDNPSFVSLAFDSACPREGVGDAVLRPGQERRIANRRVDLAHDADEAATLLRGRDNHLWVDSAVLDACNDFVLNLDVGLARSSNRSSIRNANITSVVYDLVGQSHKIARPNSCLGGYEQTAGLCFEDRDGNDVTDTEYDQSRTPRGR